MTDRLFVALWPDAGACAAVREAVEAARPMHPHVRWQAEARWHITLAFLGDVDPGRTADRLEDLAHRGFPPAQAIRLTGAGTFGPILWVGVEHGAWLADLAAQLQRRLRVADHRFRAHVTVGRTRGPDAARLARAAAASLAGHNGPPWTPQGLTLVSSVNGPKPAYHVLHTWPLVGAGDGRRGQPRPGAPS
jgi:2'-5' RNA ligase